MARKTKSLSVKFLRIDPSIPLHNHVLFWLPIVIFVTPAVCLTYPMWCFCWPSVESYESILKALGYPVFIASLAIPFTVAINRFHSSSQRAESNRLAQQNMAFNQYFDHRGHFFKYVETLILREPFKNFVKVSEPEKLYEIIFPLNGIDRQDMPAPKEIVMSKIGQKIDLMHDCVNPFVVRLNDGERPFNNKKACDFIVKVGEPFGIFFDEGIIGFVDKFGGTESESVLSLCFFNFLEVIQKAGQFSHKGFGGWTPVLAFDPLLKSSGDSVELVSFNYYLEHSLEFDKSRSQQR